MAHDPDASVSGDRERGMRRLNRIVTYVLCNFFILRFLPVVSTLKKLLNIWTICSMSLMVLSGCGVSTSGAMDRAPTRIMDYSEHYRHLNFLGQCLSGGSTASLEALDAGSVTLWIEGRAASGLRILFKRHKGCGIGVPDSCTITVRPEYSYPATLTETAKFQETGNGIYLASFPKAEYKGVVSCTFTFAGPMYLKASDGAFNFGLSAETFDGSASVNVQRRFFQDGPGMSLPSDNTRS